MNRIILGLLAATLLPAAAQAQTGKHVAVGASVGVQDYSDGHFKQSGNLAFLYRLSRTGHAQNGWSLVPGVSLDYARTDYSPDVAGSDVRVGRLRSVPALVGLGPQYRHGRTQVGLSAQAGASFHDFALDATGRTLYQDIDPKASFAAKAGADIWYDLGSRFGLYGGVWYLHDRPNAEITTGGVTTTEKWNLDYLGFSVGAAIGVF